MTTTFFVLAAIGFLLCLGAAWRWRERGAIAGVLGGPAAAFAVWGVWAVLVLVQHGFHTTPQDEVSLGVGAALAGFLSIGWCFFGVVGAAVAFGLRAIPRRR